MDLPFCLWSLCPFAIWWLAEGLIHWHGIQPRYHSNRGTIHSEGVAGLSSPWRHLLAASPPARAGRRQPDEGAHWATPEGAVEVPVWRLQSAGWSALLPDALCTLSRRLPNGTPLIERIYGEGAEEAPVNISGSHWETLRVLFPQLWAL